MVITMTGAVTTPINSNLLECQQRGDCGLQPICSYSFVYSEPCDSSKRNCSGTGTTRPTTANPTSETTSSSGDTVDTIISGNIMLLKNALNNVIDYNWNIVGYTHGTHSDDVSARTYMLPPHSYAYFDTGVPMKHTVRLVNNGETVDTKTSSNRACSIREACQYLLKSCQASFIFVTTSSMEPKINCMIQAKACNYFMYLPDLSPSTGNSDDDGDNDDNEDNENGMDSPPELDGTIHAYRTTASICAADCIWQGFPSKYLPASKSSTFELIDSLDILRRLKLGLPMSVSTCRDFEYVDDERDIFRTSKDEELYNLLNKGGHNVPESENHAVVSWLVILLILVVACLVFFGAYYYYMMHYKTGIPVPFFASCCCWCCNRGNEGYYHETEDGSTGDTTNSYGLYSYTNTPPVPSQDSSFSPVYYDMNA